ncbi:MAG: diguanylate cyclase [Planctomycetes bacterium]|nr:diguanylate cyclase [Planctomycetota bacterium]MBI3835183.1 diguanylate cyclase [Planctomycetota bacterium]
MADNASISSFPTPRSGILARFVNSILSLQFKATVLLLMLTLGATSSVAAYLLHSSGELANQQGYSQIVQSASLLAKAAAPMMQRYDCEALAALAGESANAAPLLYVIFRDTEGRQLAAAEHRNARVLQRLQRDATESVPVPGASVLQTPGNQEVVFFDVTYPVSLRSGDDDQSRSVTLLGYVRTGMIANSWQQTMARKLDMIIGVGLLATVAALPLTLLLVRRIARPLDSLADVMLKFSTGRLDTRSAVRRRDEIGRLASAFNQMADQHQLTHERIIRLNGELEERVAQRTQQLRELASREPLTALFNRRYLNETLQRRYSEAVRYESDLACIMIDLDDFKKANDRFGHQVGDEILVLAARTLMAQLRTSDVAARYGGDEFVVILPQTDLDRAKVLAERIVERFTTDVSNRFPDAGVRMSVGVASLRSPGVNDADSLIRAADHGLYEAKAKGKDTIVVA